MNSPVLPRQFDGLQPGRLWSLWDMLTLKARYFIDLGAEFHDLLALYILRDDDGNGRMTDARELETVRAHFDKVHVLCLELNLPTATELLQSRLAHAKLPRTLGEFEILRDAVYAELKNCWFAHIPVDRLDYFVMDIAVAKRVRDAFPYAYEEIRNAGTAYALGLATASVFHAMRAVERGLHVAAINLGVEFSHPIELAEWGSILREIEAKLEAMKKLPKSVKNDADLKFYSEAATEFRHFNNGWRIRVAHARETYEDAQAKAVLDHVRSFFEILSERLAEF